MLPDPNAFEGTVRLKRGRGGWEDVPYASRGGADARGIGLHDMVEAIAGGRPHRASGLLGAHVVEVVRGILAPAAEGRRRDRVARRAAAAAPGRQRGLSRRNESGAQPALPAHELVSIQTPSGRACCSSIARRLGLDRGRLALRLLGRVAEDRGGGADRELEAHRLLDRLDRCATVAFVRSKLTPV